MKLYFIHIRKTAGTALRALLEQNVGKENTCPLLSERAFEYRVEEPAWAEYLGQYGLVAGHFYTLAHYIEPERRTLTVLREPIARTLSEINHIEADHSDPLSAALRQSSVEAVLDEPDFARAVNDAQLRQLLANAGHDYDSLDTDRAVDLAMEYLERMAWFGITELLEASVELLKRTVPLDGDLLRVNAEITADGLKAHDPPPYVGRIHELNTGDLRLYARAMELLDQRLSVELEPEPEAEPAPWWARLLGR